MMNFRNPVFTTDGRIDCEIEHPAYGWIAFTADPADHEEHGREIYAAALAAGPAPYVYVPPAPLTPEQLSMLRADAYRAEADPLFFMLQRGEATEAEWLSKIEEIKARFPYPVDGV